MKTTLIVSLGLSAAIAAIGQVPALMNYQGRLTTGGTNFTGTGWFKFAVVQQTTNQARQASAMATVVGGEVRAIEVFDHGAGYTTTPKVTVMTFPGAPGGGATASATLAGDTVAAITVQTGGSNYTVGAIVAVEPPPDNYATVSFWNNTDSYGGGGEPGSAVAVPVVNGLFKVNLGDPQLMAYLDPGLFTKCPLWLRIWFSPDGSVFQRLAPDQSLTSAPYAMMAANAANASNAVAAGTMPWNGLTGVPAGTGLTLASGNTFSVVFSGSGISNAAARTDHNHLGQVWSGTNMVGLSINTSGAGTLAAAIYGAQGGAAPSTAGSAGLRGASLSGYGVLGESTSGTAVLGNSVGSAGTTYGVQGWAASTNGIGVKGYNSSTNGNTFGAQGLASSPTGIGVYGLHSAGAGTGAGVKGETASTDGNASGVLGRVLAVSTNGTSAGVRGLNEDLQNSGIGVFGYSGPTRVTYAGDPGSGVYGQSAAAQGSGVVGQADIGTDASGVWGKSAVGSGGLFYGGSYGVYASSTNGIGGSFAGGRLGLTASSSVGTGGSFAGTTNGVWATSSRAGSGAGLQGAGFNGVLGVASQINGNGLVGQADLGTSAYGVLGTSASGYGGVFSGGSCGLSVSSANTGLSVVGGTCGLSVSGGAQGITVANATTGLSLSGNVSGVLVSGGTRGIAVSNATTGLLVSGGACGLSVAGGTQGIAVANAGTGLSISGGSQGIAVANAGNGLSVSGGTYGLAVTNATTGLSVSGATSGITVSDATTGLSVSGSSYAVSGSGAAYFSYNSGLSRPNLEVHDTGSGNYARLRFSSSNNPYWDIAVGGGSANVMNFYNSANGNVMSLDSSGWMTCKKITLTGGADLAEPFPMSDDEIAAGSVVVIDDQNPGRLKLSRRAYDNKVAGVVSGANGIEPGLSMVQAGALEPGRNVALTGRVYVQADADACPIAPGDLLTTSNIPGCAMKAANLAKAQGAILGKAMTPLKRGRGLVLVLVTLQ